MKSLSYLNTYKAICDNIRKARLEENYTQQYVARQIGISLHAYGNIERGQSTLDLKRLLQIAAILNKTPANLLDTALLAADNTKAAHTGDRQDPTLQSLVNILTDIYRQCKP